jgi:RNA polymerase sigma-70 factor, ECF subfamily
MQSWMNRTGVVGADEDLCTIEQDDFEQIVFQNQKRIFRTLLFLVRDSDAAENLTQECFLRAFRMRDQFRGESAVTTWLVRIAINLAYDHNRNRKWAFWRKLSRTEEINTASLVDSGRSPEQAMIESQSLNAVWIAVGRLSARQRTVFLLRFIEEMPLEDIGAVMGLKAGTVKSHLHRAIQAVRIACAPTTD